MKIGIIGGGFYGCYIANKLSKKHKITIFEKNSSILTEAAKNNQYRLHQGYHYPRCYKTIKQTSDGYKKFKKEFKKYLYFPKNNYYLIHEQSLINFKRYINILSKKLKFSKIQPGQIKYIKNSKNYLGAINTKEGVILLDKLLPKIKSDIKKNCIVKFKALVKNVDENLGQITLSSDKKYNFDCIINCTYTNPNLGLLKSNKYDVKYELAALLIPNYKLNNVPGITIMDGKFVSLYPRDRNSFSISSVKYTPVKKFSSLANAKYHLNKIKKISFRNNIKRKIIKDFSKYIDLGINLSNSKVEFAIKTKFRNDKNDIRVANIKYNNKVLSVMSGKLDAAPAIFEQIKTYLKKL